MTFHCFNLNLSSKPSLGNNQLRAWLLMLQGTILRIKTSMWTQLLTCLSWGRGTLHWGTLRPICRRAASLTFSKEHQRGRSHCPEDRGPRATTRAWVINRHLMYQSITLHYQWIKIIKHRTLLIGWNYDYSWTFFLFHFLKPDEDDFKVFWEY
jgi:hypothetical protein